MLAGKLEALQSQLDGAEDARLAVEEGLATAAACTLSCCCSPARNVTSTCCALTRPGQSSQMVGLHRPLAASNREECACRSQDSALGSAEVVG